MKNKKILILGSSGQIGKRLVSTFKHNCKMVNFTRKELDLNEIDDIKKKINNVNPDLIINAAAYTSVDLAEREKETCLNINSKAPEIIAKTAKKLDVPLIHYSTDYVFDGEKKGYYYENDKTNPLNFYGESKLYGENVIENNLTKYIIIRTSWVYDDKNKNFISSIKSNLDKDKKNLNVINDQFGAPTWAKRIAEITFDLVGEINKKSVWGKYHFSSSGYTSWFKYAKLIAKIYKPEKIKSIKSISSANFKQDAKRPKNSRLSNKKISKVLNLTPISWSHDIELCIRGQNNDKENS